MDTSKSNDLVPTPLRHPPVEVETLALPPRSTAVSAPPDALGLLKALRRRWALALGLGLLLAALIGPAAWFLTPPAKYTASSTLYVAMNPKRIMWNPQSNEARPETFQRTQVALLTDRYILAHALAKPEVSA